MGKFLEKLMGAPEVKPLLSNDHFSVDGTLLQAWASHASLERIDGQDDPPPPPSGPGEGFGQPKVGKKRAKGDFRGVKLSNDTHRSSTDPEALLARKSKVHPALPSYRGDVLMDNRHDLIVNCRLTQADGYGERDAAKAMAADLAGAHQKTIGADKNYDTKGFVAEMRRIGVTPHVAQNTLAPVVQRSMAVHPAQGVCPIDQCPPWDREGVWLDQGFRRPAPVQGSRHRERERRVWPARDRLQPDPPGQPAQTRHGCGMNRWLPRGVPMRRPPGSPNGAKRLKSGVLSR